MQHNDKLTAAEEFIEEVIAPQKKADAERQADQSAHARSRSDELQAAKHAIAASGIDLAPLESFAKERSNARPKRAYLDWLDRVDPLRSPAGINLSPATTAPAGSPDIIIGEVTFIRSFADQGTLIDSNIGLGHNWARFRVESHALEGTGRLSFFTLWQSPLDVPAIVTPRVNFTVNAHLSAHAGGVGPATILDWNPSAHGIVHVRTTAWGMDSQQQNVLDDRKLAEIGATAGFFDDDSNKSIRFHDVLQGSGTVVMPHAFTLFEVELLTDWRGDGDIKLDAQSGTHRVILPWIAIGGVETQSPQSIMLSVTVSPLPGGAVANLVWSGANTAQVEIYDNGTRIGTVANSGSFGLTTQSGSHVFRVCETGGTRCSNDVTVTVP